MSTENQQTGFKIAGDWSNQSRNLRAKYPFLTDADVKFEPGKEDELLQKIQTRLGKSREEVIGILKSSQNHLPPNR